MTKISDWQIPPSVTHNLEHIPQDRPIALLIRHSVRDALPEGAAAYSLPITEAGYALAHQLGTLLGDKLRSLHTSPLTRCTQTAEAMKAGAKKAIPILQNRLLGDPGVFVLDGKFAWTNWESIGHKKVMEHLLSASTALPGMARPTEAARYLVRQLLALGGNTPGIHTFVTHDSIVAPTVSHMLQAPLSMGNWPWFLEGAFFWQDGNQVHTVYRSFHESSDADRLCQFSKNDVIEFAKREIAATIGLDSPARFFLAGGAFKSLITGKNPRDLDLWAPSIQDRQLLVQTLHKRGAKSLSGRPFADAFELADRIIELPHKVGPESLDERLALFDISVSAIGVEHHGNETWSALIHPLAVKSLKQREVLLLKPLVNWKYGLTTLERMRRYAVELSFSSQAEEESAVWQIFDSQSEEWQTGMIERYKRTCLGGFNVLQEIKKRQKRM